MANAADHFSFTAFVAQPEFQGVLGNLVVYLDHSESITSQLLRNRRKLCNLISSASQARSRPDLPNVYLRVIETWLETPQQNVSLRVKQEMDAACATALEALSNQQIFDLDCLQYLGQPLMREQAILDHVRFCVKYFGNFSQSQVRIEAVVVKLKRVSRY